MSSEILRLKPTSSEARERWFAVQQQYPNSNFLQSPAWGEMNQLIGHKVMIIALQDAWCQMIVKNAKRGRYLEIPGGPLIDWEDNAKVATMFEQIRSIGRVEGCVFVRLRIQERQNPTRIEQLQSLGLRLAPMHLHAEHTVMIDLTETEDTLLAKMRRQTRYEIRRADRLGLKVNFSRTEAAFREFHAVQVQTAERQHFVPPDLDTLLAERQAFGDNARLYCARDAEGVALAYGLILIDGAEAEYFEAASTEGNSKLPGSYALLWRAMRDLKALGVKRFNLWGIAPPGAKHHRYSGVTTFKTGFGGKNLEFVPAMDLVLKPGRYLINLIIEKIRKKMRNL